MQKILYLKQHVTGYQLHLKKSSQEGETLRWALKNKLEFAKGRSLRVFQSEGTTYERAFASKRFGRNVNYSIQLN